MLIAFCTKSLTSSFGSCRFYSSSAFYLFTSTIFFAWSSCFLFSCYTSWRNEATSYFAGTFACCSFYSTTAGYSFSNSSLSAESDSTTLLFLFGFPPISCSSSSLSSTFLSLASYSDRFFLFRASILSDFRNGVMMFSSSLNVTLFF